jgi:hypothetical protein
MQELEIIKKEENWMTEGQKKPSKIHVTSKCLQKSFSVQEKRVFTQFYQERLHNKPTSSIIKRKRKKG